MAKIKNKNFKFELIFNLKNKGKIGIQLKQGNKLIDEEYLTISQGLDILLIDTIDNMIIRNRIDRLSLNNVVIRGKIEGHALWGMVLKTAGIALGI